MIEKISIDKLIPYANNARTHSDEQVAQIAASIREFGFNNPVLIAEDDTSLCQKLSITNSTALSDSNSKPYGGLCNELIMVLSIDNES